MSDQQNPQVRSEAPELNDAALEQVAGGCPMGISHITDDTLQLTVEPFPVTSPTIDGVFQ